MPEVQIDADGRSGGPNALLFPGQGSQDRALHELARQHCPELIAQAAATLGVDPFERIETGTAYLQPALYCGGLAHWRAAGAPAADFAAGHSLGELAALSAAGYLSPDEGMRLVLARATAMHRASEAGEAGGLLAVVGPRERALALGERHGLTLAADNEPEQIVLSGPLVGLQAARAGARECGLKAVRLRVPAALHSSAMLPAVAPFRRALETATLAAPRMVVIANVTAAPFGDVVSELALGVVSPVRWRETVLGLHAAGVRSYSEMSTAGVLSGLVERTLATA
ncbi:MAG TPA: ACP S-malonyltransferase [Solirubrobacterales bacterium]|nr:ACP S-malonyltransferase [Solirubrobacterales bacterium]